MNRKSQLCWLLCAGLCSGVSADATDPGQEYAESECGQDISMRDVLVLDLERFRREPELAQNFVDEYAGHFRLVNTQPEVIITRSRASKDPQAVIKRARKFGVKGGCDLVLVLKTGPYLGRQRGMKSRIRDKGYAMVVMGQRIP